MALWREVLLDLDRTLSALPPRQPQAATLRDVFGMPTGQVCAAVGVSPAYQRILPRRARAVLCAALTCYHGR